jgi:hypothetical protein
MQLSNNDKHDRAINWFWNKHIDRLLDEARRGKNKTQNKTQPTSKPLLLNDK